MSATNPTNGAHMTRPATQDDARVGRTTWRIDVSDVVPLPGRFEIAVDVIAPTDLTRRPDDAGTPLILSCLPGGFLSRRYYDLEIDGHRDYSFAEAMARAGHIVLAFDHLGIGESSRPDPIEGGYALGVETIAQINQRALDGALERLARGDATLGLPPLEDPTTFGVGHSMGSSLSVEQQASARPHRGLILFSFTTRGVPKFLNETQRAVAHDPIRARAELARITRESMGSPYPTPLGAATQSEGDGNGEGDGRDEPDHNEEDRVAAFGVGTAPQSAEAALQAAATNLLGMAGLLAMIPGGYAPAAERVDVPVLVALGDHDLHDETGLSDMLPKSPHVETFVLDDCWHCHFVSNRREALWTRVLEWIAMQRA